MDYQIAVCDDEQVERKKIEMFLKRYASEHNVKLYVDSYSCGEDLLKSYENKKAPYDMIFLDMEMKGIDGIETARKIRAVPDNHVLITYVTNFLEHMHRSFDVQAFQYLVKPLNYDLFQEKLEDMRKLLESYETHVMVVDQKEGEVLLDVEEIQCIETVKQISGRGKLEFTLIEGKVIITGKLSDYEEKLSQQGFVRVHRTALVNLRFIYKFKGDSILLKTGKELPLSKKYAKELRDRFSDFLIMKYRR